ncbi:MAG: hypothetical protein Q9222_002709 [Ikaeria aurantiellina]
MYMAPTTQPLQNSPSRWDSLSHPPALPSWDNTLVSYDRAGDSSHSWPTTSDLSSQSSEATQHESPLNLSAEEEQYRCLTAQNPSYISAPTPFLSLKTTQASIPVGDVEEPFPSHSSVESLPPQNYVSELVNDFFTQNHHFLPCIHQETFVNRLNAEWAALQDCPLLWAIIAVTAITHDDSELRIKGHRWFKHARRLLDFKLDQCSRENTTFQACVWVVFAIYTSGDHMRAWLLTSRAYHVAVAVGIHQIDRPGNPTATYGTDLECEERRKILWALYILDKSISCLVSLPLVVDDRLLSVNFPISDESFQGNSNSDVSPFSIMPDHFGRSEINPGIHSSTLPSTLVILSLQT